MIPLVDKSLVDLLEQRQTSVIPASYVRLGYGVSAGRDAHRDTSDGEVLRGQLDEVEGKAVAPRLPGPHPTRVHRRGQRGLDGEALAASFRFRRADGAPHDRPQRDGQRCEPSAWTSSTFRNSTSGYNAGSSSRANVVFPAPFAPAITIASGMATSGDHHLRFGSPVNLFKTVRSWRPIWAAPFTLSRPSRCAWLASEDRIISICSSSGISWARFRCDGSSATGASRQRTAVRPQGRSCRIARRRSHAPAGGGHSERR